MGTRDPRSTILHPKCILLTGCAGFIGWKVTEHLLAQGYRVVGVDNLNDAYDVRLKQWRLAQLEGRPGFTFYRLDICDREAVRRLLAGDFGGEVPRFHAVVNLAARAGVRQSVEDPWAYFATNVTGTLNLLELCRELGVEKFILASTSSLYGSADLGLRDSQPEIRNARWAFREDMATDHPLSPYAASKKAAEVLCHTYHYLYGMDVAVLRYFTVYGPAGRPDMSLFRFVQWIVEGRPVVVYGDGKQSRDFTYVDDIARGTVAALHYLEVPEGRLQTPEGHQLSAVSSQSSATRNSQSAVHNPKFEIFNLGSDHPVVLLDVIRLVEELVGRRAQVEHQPRHPADVLATWADIGKAERLLGWRPETPFDVGVRRLVNWYQEERAWAREVPTSG
ncbi:MAG: SDR family NAD(P)-dependent oxidoreductase [Anaerolineae bacterium]